MGIARGIFSGILGFVLAVVLVVLGVVVTVNLTILNPRFVTAELDKVDAHALIADEVKSRLLEDEPHMAQLLDEIMVELDPWLREQTAVVVRDGCAYLQGEGELNTVISLEPVRATVKQSLAQAIRDSLPPELEGASQSQVELFISQMCAEVDRHVPEQIEVNEAFLGPEITALLHKAREIVHYVELGYKVLIGLAVLLVLAIALIQWWRVKPIALHVGIAFAVSGVIVTAGALAARSLICSAIQSDAPPEIGAKLPQLIADFTHPLLVYGPAFLIGGLVLIVLSVVLKSSVSEYA